jgi:hypothetical protein
MVAVLICSHTAGGCAQRASARPTTRADSTRRCRRGLQSASGPVRILTSAPLLRHSARHGQSSPSRLEQSMLLIREVFYCKPGKVRQMVEKFVAMSDLNEKLGMPRMRVMTDFCAERYWTVIAEMEVSSVHEFEQMMSSPPDGSQEDQKQMEKIMKGYHDLVEHGRREIYKIEN